MLLDAFLEDCYLPSRISVSSRYAAALRTLCRRWSDHLGRKARLADFSERSIAAFLSAHAGDYSAVSTNSFRRWLLSLWRVSVEQGLLDREPRARTIRSLPEQPPMPEAWTVEEIGRLIDATDFIVGTIQGVNASAWWRSLILTDYWTGCRIGALAACRSHDYRSGDGLFVRRQKNGRAQWYPLPRSCCREIDQTWPAARELLWPWPHCRRHLFTEMRRIVESAGLFCPHTHGQLFQKLRRTCLSYCAAVDPEIAQRQAGHASYATTLKHYIDPRIAAGRSASDLLANPIQHAPNPRLRIYG